jgi:two-component system, chemotaxis family, sensor kinase CheA
VSDEILEAFAAESADILEGLEASISGLGEGRQEALDPLFRGVHTLKGSASIVGLPHLEAFAHAFESRLSSLRSRGLASLTSDAPGALLACRDRLAVLLGEGQPAIGADVGLAIARLSPEEEALLSEVDRALGLAESAPPCAASPAPARVQAVAPAAAASAARAASETEPAMKAASVGGYSRVPNAKLDAIIEEASELIQRLSEFGRSLKEGGEASFTRDSSLAEELLGLHALASRHYRTILEARTIPFGEVVERYRRAVAEIARESGKEIDFEVLGADTEIDKALADKLAEPLLHLVRNAADHGVEKPEARLAAGKGRRGRITLGARRDSSFLVVRLEDDGRGVDPEAIRARALEEGLDLEELKRQGCGPLDLLLKPGFSLSREVTKWSGRGVGLDAVDRSVRQARGTLRLETRPGSGFAAEIRLPLALSLVEGFTASAGGCDLLLPFDAVDSCVAIGDGVASGDGAAESGGAEKQRALRRTVAIGDRLMPALDLSLLYGDGSGAGRIAAIVNSGGAQVALLVDSVGEALSAAVRPLDRHLADSPGVAGIAALGDGGLVLVVDAAELVRLAIFSGAS